jgi:A/G-specific adenine glycosylase
MPHQAQKVRILRREIMKWGKGHLRNFPWRVSNNPYRILIAEMMLRRTRADQVKNAYESFLRAFPNVSSFANSNAKTLRRILRPIGLRWRAENFVDLAKCLRVRKVRRITGSKQKLYALPGVGPYVGNSVLCFAFSKRCEIVDTNVVRVIGRVFGLKSGPDSRRNSEFIQLARAALPLTNVRLYNYALLDFASLICTSKSPNHAECPLLFICSYAKKRGVRT